MHVIDEEGSNVATTEVSVQMHTEALRQLDGASQARAVTVMLSHSRTGLLAAIAAQDLPGIVEFKAKASAIQEMSKQLQLGRDMRFDAQEFVRRAERGLCAGLREGQANGTVASEAEARSMAAIDRDIDLGRSTKSPEDLVAKPKVSDYLSKTERTGGKDPNTSVFAMTDGVSDEQFEQALAEARDEGNLSRANVARKAKDKAKAEAPQPDPPPKREAEPESSPSQYDHTLDGTKILMNAANRFESAAEYLPQIDPSTISAEDKKAYLNTIYTSMATIRKTLKGFQ